ncbi:hypothetical protein [Alicyclobacillus fodiniaquatilis]|uniref:Uncharacterized protein n=1 Tax=Alicyclobacillus fodiniaquatilis TaxID=1661150 RepID=A0ABW4JET5_9BACL
MLDEKRPTRPESDQQRHPDGSQPYPQDRRAYENMMRHDAYRRVKGRVRQTKWVDQE